MVARAILARRLLVARTSLTSTGRNLAPRCSTAVRPYASSSSTFQASPTTREAPAIWAPLPSLASSVARVLPKSIPDEQLPLDRAMSEDIVARVLDQVRTAADAKTVDEAKGGWAIVDAQIRQELASKSYPASALTDLTNLVISSNNDPRRHPIAFNLYRIAFGSDPAALPSIQFDTADLTSANPEANAASSVSNNTRTDWGDWQAAYQWASLVLQGRAPPPPGTYILVPGDQRIALATQSNAALRVFVHLATQGHPRGIFGIGRHLLSTLERSVDPTALGGATSTAGGSGQTRHETLQEVERLYRLAGEGGVEEAWFELGSIYIQGKWVRKDGAKARSFLEEGVQRGSPRACQALAQMLTQDVHATTKAPSSLSLGVNHSAIDDAGKEKLQKSLELLERGAELGSAECAFSAGMRYLLQPSSQENNASDPSASLDLSLDPSKPSSVDPIVQAKSEHSSKWAVEANDELAAKWFALAVEGGNTLAMMNLARMYLEGRVTPPPPSTSSSQDSTPPTDRQLQLLHSSDLYARILAKAMGPEGQRAKALAEVQAKMKGNASASGSSSTPEPGLSSGSGRLDDLGARAEEGLRMVREEMAILAERQGEGD